jgi:hypothetical protein
VTPEPIKIVLLRVWWHNQWEWRVTIHYDDGGTQTSTRADMTAAMDWVRRRW